MPNPGPLSRNRLLAALPHADQARLRPHLRPVAYPGRTTLLQSGRPIDAVHFPESGLVSMVAMLADGGAAEVGLVGNEGMIGLPLLLGASSASLDGLVQNALVALRMEGAAFRRAVSEVPSLMELLLRYALVFQEQVVQTAVCNGHHLLEQRLACRLLMAHDRIGTDEFPMTHEVLATMLCVHRPGMTLAARALQQAGLIRSGHGQVSILDRPALEAAACECYAAVRTRFDALFGS